MTTPQNTAYKIPPRKWYNLEQAIKRIKTLTGEEITKDDLLHYWYLNKLELSVYFAKNANNEMRIGSHTFQPKDYSLLEQPTAHIKENQLFFERQSGIGDFEIDDIFSKSEYDDNEFSFSGLISIFSSSFLSVKLEQEILNNGLCLSFARDLITAKHPQTKERLRFHIKYNNFKQSRELFLTENDLYILEEHLQDFLCGNNEIKQIKQAEQETPTGRPTKEIKYLVQKIAIATFNKYPTHSRNKLSTVIYQHLEKFYFGEYEIISERTLDNYLKEINIGNTNKKTHSRDKISVIDPFKSE